MAASLKGIDPALKRYLKIHRLPDVYEALLTGLAIMCPADPYQFIIDNLKRLQNSNMEGLTWDVFIEDHMRPKAKVLSESNLDYIFNFDEAMQPTAEMNETAYDHYNTKLKTMCWNSWMQFHLLKRRSRQELERKMGLAAMHHRHRILRTQLHNWIEWVRYRKGRQTMAFNKIQHVYHVAVGRVLFEAWHNVTVDAKKTREYFERLERGENMDDDDVLGQGSGEARDDISLLPRKDAIKIFSYLDITDLARCSCVCRSWKVICQANALWSRLDLTQVRHRVTDRVAMQLLTKCRPYLVHLNLRGCEQISSKTFYSIRECRNLQDLNLSECSAVNDDTMKMVVEGCKILLYLNVSHTNITDASLRSLANQVLSLSVGKEHDYQDIQPGTVTVNCCNLQYLSLAFCRKFSDRGLLYIANGKGAKRLVYLDLSGCVQVTSAGFMHLASGCVNIQSLAVNELLTLDDLCMQNVSEKCKNIRSLSLLGSPKLTDEAFKKLAMTKKLQKVKIESNQKITDASFKTIAKHSSELRHLYLTDCCQITDSSLKALSACRNLTVLNLADCVRITDTGVRHIVESPCGSTLQELNLTNCIRVGDIALVNIHKRCHKLAYLSVCFCEHISEAGVELLGSTHSLTSLDISGCNCGDVGLSALGNNPRFKDVTLSECTGITDLGLQKFAQQCTEIERLDLSHCQLITDGAIKNLAFCCRMLTYLNLAGCKLVTDLSVQYLSGVCHYLRHLDISGSLHVSDKSLKYLRKGCKKLQVLVILYCKGISKNSANKLLRHVPEVIFSDDEVPAFYNY